MLTAQQINLIQVARSKKQLFALATERNWGCSASFLSKHMTRVPSDLHMQDNCISAFGWLWYTISDSSEGDALYYPSGPMDYSNDFRFSFGESAGTPKEVRDLLYLLNQLRPHGKPDVDERPRVNHESKLITLPDDGSEITKYAIETKCGKIAFVGDYEIIAKLLDSSKKWAQKGGRPV